jgi:hypothetical protein
MEAQGKENLFINTKKILKPWERNGHAATGDYRI